jgi:hypothetical protein
MVISFPCQACGVSLDHGAVSLRFATSSVVTTGPGRTKLVPSGRQTEFLLCPACAAYLEVGLGDIRRERLAAPAREVPAAARHVPAATRRAATG